MFSEGLSISSIPCKGSARWDGTEKCLLRGLLFSGGYVDQKKIKEAGIILPGLFQVNFVFSLKILFYPSVDNPRFREIRRPHFLEDFQGFVQNFLGVRGHIAGAEQFLALEHGGIDHGMHIHAFLKQL